MKLASVLFAATIIPGGYVILAVAWIGYYYTKKAVRTGLAGPTRAAS